MEHNDVIEQDVGSRYLSGELAPDERAAFEEHFIDCPRCLDALESADALRHGLKAMAAQDALHGRVEPMRRSWRWRNAVTSAAGIAAALAIAAGTADLVRTRRELARMSRVAADVNGQADRAQSRARELADRVRQLEAGPPAAPPAPAAGQSSAPVFALTTVRGGGTSTPPNRVVLSGAPDWIVLSLELDDSNTSGRYRATLRDAQGRERWSDDRLNASTNDALGIALRAALFDQGDYSLDVERQPPRTNGWIPAGRYTFRVVKNR